MELIPTPYVTTVSPVSGNFIVKNRPFLTSLKALIRLSGRLTDSHLIGRSFTNVKVLKRRLRLPNSREVLERDGN
jgi:hypothetical protein